MPVDISRFPDLPQTDPADLAKLGCCIPRVSETIHLDRDWDTFFFSQFCERHGIPTGVSIPTEAGRLAGRAWNARDEATRNAYLQQVRGLIFDAELAAMQRDLLAAE